LKDIQIDIDKKLRPGQEFRGAITVRYSGSYDSISLNTQILDSNELMLFTSCNGKKMSSRSSRLFISRDSMPDNRAEFSAIVTFEPKKSHEIKFRASIIEQHKEVESDVVFCVLEP